MLLRCPGLPLLMLECGVLVLPLDFALRNPELDLEPGDSGKCSSWSSDRGGLAVVGESGSLKSSKACISLVDRFENASWVFDCTSLSSSSDVSGPVTPVDEELLDCTGTLFWGVDWLMPLYCRQVAITASRAAILCTALFRCSLTSADSPATDSSCSSVRLDGSQFANIRSVKSLSSTRSIARAAILSTNVSRAI